MRKVVTEKYSRENIAGELNRIKADYIRNGQSSQANEVWCIESILKIQTEYLNAFELLKQKEYYKAWCAIEQVELTLGFLAPHHDIGMDEYMLSFIDEHIRKYQKIYPYQIFISPELVEEEKKCNICNQIMSIRNPCGHEVGEIYNGEMCCRIVTKVQILGIAMVESPLQKYSVPFLKDEATGEVTDHYNYEVVEYLTDKLMGPFDAWDFELSSKIYPHTHFASLGRNDKCPCGSGKKYKKCCLDKEGVKLPQYDFMLHGQNPEML